MRIWRVKYKNQQNQIRVRGTAAESKEEAIAKVIASLEDAVGKLDAPVERFNEIIEVKAG